MTTLWKRAATWLSLFAIGWHTLLPLAPMPDMAEGRLAGGICTSDGARPAGRGTLPVPPGPLHQHAQCAHCAPCAFSVAVGPPSAAQGLVLPARQAAARGERPLHAALSSQPGNPGARRRAPPSAAIIA